MRFLLLTCQFQPTAQSQTADSQSQSLTSWQEAGGRRARHGFSPAIRGKRRANRAVFRLPRERGGEDSVL
nr:hypothetical protein BaRGS_020305 [Batillaria attramentaria]